ncbi:Os01g0552500, partial [Oryza sativa Japonica Group]
RRKLLRHQRSHHNSLADLPRRCRLAAVYIAAHSVVIESVLGQESRRRRCPPRRSVPHRHRSPLPARPPPTPRRKPFCRQVSADAFHAELLLAATDPCCQVAVDAFRTELLLAAPPRRRR